MRRRLAAALALALLLLSVPGCGGETEAESPPVSVCVGEDFESLDPIYATEPGDQTVLMHLYEPLMRRDGDGQAVPAAAQEVERREDRNGGITYTFRLRSARWSDGRTVRAGDYVYAWRRLADPENGSPFASLLSGVAGYDAAREAGDMSLLEIRAKNEITLSVRLEKRDGLFLSQVCTAPAGLPLRQDVLLRLARREGGEPWWADVESLVTNGPFRAEAYTTGDALTVRRNERYTGEAPAAERLSFRFSPSPHLLYHDGSVDAAWPAPLTMAGSQDAPSLTAQVLVFNCEVLADQAIRRALCESVDRQTLAAAAGGRAAEGLIPPGAVQTGDFRAAPLLDNNPETYDARCAEQRSLLEVAGYSGAGLGELELVYQESGINSTVAHLLCEQWKKALDITVIPRGMTASGLAKTMESREYTVAMTELRALCADPEEFLEPWSREDNPAAFDSSAYNTLLAIIAGALDPDARLGCLHDAEELLIAECAVSPLYHRQSAWILRPTLTGAERDPRGFFLFHRLQAASEN